MRREIRFSKQNYREHVQILMNGKIVQFEEVVNYFLCWNLDEKSSFIVYEWKLCKSTFQGTISVQDVI